MLTHISQIDANIAIQSSKVSNRKERLAQAEFERMRYLARARVGYYCPELEAYIASTPDVVAIKNDKRQIVDIEIIDW